MTDILKYLMLSYNVLNVVGLKIGDMGVKLGLNGLDNGWMMFSNYRIPRSFTIHNFENIAEPLGKSLCRAKDINFKVSQIFRFSKNAEI